MLNIITKITKNEKQVGNPNSYFELHLKSFVEACNSNEKLRQVLFKIDGVTDISEDYVKTRFGGTSLDNISTGCKSALIMMQEPSLVVKQFEMGTNVLNLLAHDKDNMYTVYSDNVPVGLDDDGKFYLDYKECKSGTDLCDKLCRIFDSEDVSV